ncbi:MAG: ankyrin repeat domain-containing protein [Pseudomonadota bacterium]
MFSQVGSACGKPLFNSDLPLTQEPVDLVVDPVDRATALMQLEPAQRVPELLKIWGFSGTDEQIDSLASALQRLNVGDAVSQPRADDSELASLADAVKAHLDQCRVIDESHNCNGERSGDPVTEELLALYRQQLTTPVFDKSRVFNELHQLLASASGEPAQAEATIALGDDKALPQDQRRWETLYPKLSTSHQQTVLWGLVAGNQLQVIEELNPTDAALAWRGAGNQTFADIAAQNNNQVLLVYLATRGVRPSAQSGAAVNKAPKPSATALEKNDSTSSAPQSTSHPSPSDAGYGLTEKEREKALIIKFCELQMTAECKRQKMSTVHIVARHGDATFLTKALDAGFPANEKDSYGRTPLIYAVFSQEIEKASLLAEHLPKKALTTQDTDGFTALHHAAKLGCVDVAKLLLEKNATQNTIVDNQGNTWLHHAASRSDLMAPLIAEYQSQIRSALELKNSALRTVLTVAAGSGHLDTVNALIDAGARGGEALVVALEKKEVAVANALMRCPFIDVDAKIPERGFTALHYAVIANDKGMVNWLLDKGANIWLGPTLSGNSPTAIFAFPGRPLVTRKIATPMTLAQSLDIQDMLDLFLKRFPEANFKFVGS